MGVHETHYFMVGTKLDYQLDLDEYQEYLDNGRGGIQPKNGLNIVPDYYGGRYTYVGHIISRSEHYGRLDDHVNPKPRPTPETVARKIKLWFGLNVECDYIAFTNHS